MCGHPSFNPTCKPLSLLLVSVPSSVGRQEESVWSAQRRRNCEKQDGAITNNGAESRECTGLVNYLFAWWLTLFIGTVLFLKLSQPMTLMSCQAFHGGIGLSWDGHTGNVRAPWSFMLSMGNTGSPNGPAETQGARGSAWGRAGSTPSASSPSTQHQPSGDRPGLRVLLISPASDLSLG